MEYTDLKKDRRLFSRIGFAFVILTAVTFIAQYGMFIVLSPWIEANGEAYEKYQLLFGSVPMYVFGVPACIFWLRRIPKADSIAKSSWGPGRLIVTFMIAYGLLYGSNIFSVLLMFFAGYLRGEPIMNGMAEMVQSSDPFVMFAVVVILAPILEELLFRKLLLDRIHPYGEKFCVLLSGLLFGLMHGNFYQFFYAFFLGVVFAYIYLKTGKIRYSVMFHMVINFMGSVVASWLLKLMTDSGIIENPMAVYENMVLVMGILGYGFLILALCISGLVLLVIYRKQITFKKGVVELSEGAKWKAACLNVGTILFFAACAAQFALSLF